MREPIEIANTWKGIVNCFNSTREKSPKETMELILSEYNKKLVLETFATISAIKIHDGRIYGDNRKYMNSIEVNPEAVKHERFNPVIYAGLDDIHTTHINQLITELRKGIN